MYKLRLKNAEDNKQDFDAITVETIKRNFYVDDCLKSVTGEGKAVCLVGQLCELLSKGGFHLTKWISNSKNVLNSVPEAERSPSVKDLNFDQNAVLTERALDVQWNVNTDTLSFKIANREKPATRRGILSIICSVYVSPCILLAKAIQQELCLRALAGMTRSPNLRNNNGALGLATSRNLSDLKYRDVSSYQTSHLYNAASYTISQTPPVKDMELRPIFVRLTPRETTGLFSRHGKVEVSSS